MKKAFKRFGEVKENLSGAGSPWYILSVLLIKRRVASVEILGVKVILSDADAVAEALIVNDLALAEIFYRIADIGIVRETQNVVISRARLLLC